MLPRAPGTRLPSWAALAPRNRSAPPWPALLAWLVCGAIPATAVAAPPAPPLPTEAARELAVGATPLALLSSVPGDPRTTLHLVAPSAGPGRALALGPAVATLEHRPLATVRAGVQGDAVLVVVDEAARGDRSFESALVRLRPGERPVRLAGQLVHASRPVPRPGSREVLVSRGQVAMGASGARNDRLTIDAIDLDTGASRTVLRARGNLLFVAAVTDREVIAYRVDGGGTASLLAADLDGGRERTVLASLPPFARDFSLDGASVSLVFQNRHETDPARWVVDVVDLGTGRSTRLHEDSSMQLAPHLWPDGSLALTSDVARPLERLDVGKGVRGALPRGLPRGVARVAGIDAKRARVAVSSSEGGGLPLISIVTTASGEATRVATPPNARLTVAGFLAPRGAPR